MVLMTYWSGARIKEVALTKVGDVLALDGSVKNEIRLTSEQTKGKHARTIVLADKLRKEILTYLQTRFDTKQLIALTYTDAMNRGCPVFCVNVG